MIRQFPVVVGVLLLVAGALSHGLAPSQPPLLRVPPGPVSLGPIDVPCEGHLIQADPALTDEHFIGSLVLICVQDTSGTLGMVVNHATARHARQVVPDAPLALGMARGGGPLGNGQGVLVYADGDALRLTTADVRSHFPEPGWLRPPRVTPEAMRVVAVGYAAWSVGQLEEEVQAGAWTLTPLSLEQALAATPK